MCGSLWRWGRRDIKGGGVPRGTFRLQGWRSLTRGAGDSQAAMGGGDPQAAEEPGPWQVQQRVPGGKAGACWGLAPHTAVPQITYVRRGQVAADGRGS